MFKLNPSFNAASLLCLLPMVAAAMPIYDGGKEQAVVVIPDSPSPITLHAGKELVRYLDLATTGNFQLKKESEVLPNDGPFRIYVGVSNAVRKKGLSIEKLKKNNYIIFPDKKALYLVGLDDADGEVPVDDAAGMGSLLAIYDWLDRELGVRWLWPGEAGTHVPAFTKLETKEGPPRHGTPTFEHSDLRFYPNYFVPGKPTRYGRSGSLDDRSFVSGSEWLRNHKVVRTSGRQTYYGHGYIDYWERFGATHPEYFAQRPDGKRGPVDGRTYLTQSCVSNPELHKVIIKDWLEKRTPERPWINGCENDRRTIDPFCMCAACKAWDVPEALASVPNNPWHLESREASKIDPYEKISMSDRYARFLLALLEEGKKHDPKAKVVGYAYSSYSDAPVKTKLNEDVVIIVVPPYVYPLDKDKEDLGRKLWDSWKATGAQLVYRPNDFLVGYVMPYVYPRQFGRDFKHYYDNGMLATDFDSMTAMWGTQGVNLYMLGRLHARPELSPDAVLDEYFSAFGGAKERIRDYIGYWEEITARCNSAFQEKTKGGWAVMMKAGHTVFTPDVYAEGKRLLEAAAEAAKGEPMSERRVTYLQVWLEHARLTTGALTIYRSIRNPENPSISERERFNAALDHLKEFRKENDRYLEGANWVFMARWEPWRLWKR